MTAPARHRPLQPLGDSVRSAVCIPVKGSPPGLARLLDSLARLEPIPPQVILAVDGADPDALRLARERGMTGIGVTPAGGSYVARNAAIEALAEDVEVVAFTDSDVVVPPSWLEQHVRALNSAHRSGGPVRLLMSIPPRPAEVVDAFRHLDQEFYVSSLGFAVTANLAVRREVLQEIRFDARLRSGGDFEFGRRASEAGFTIAFTEDAPVEHPARGSAAEVMKKIWRVAGGASQLEGAGHRATERRRARPSIISYARSVHPSGSAWWRARVLALDSACRLLYAVRVPSIIWPAVRRRIRR